MADDDVLTPGGLRPRSLVFQIESGAILDGGGVRIRKLHSSGKVLQDFGVVSRRPQDRPVMPNSVVQPRMLTLAFGSGWITYTSWTNNTGAPSSLFSTKWVVP